MRNAHSPRPDDLIADVMTLIFPLVLGAILLLVLVDSYACR
jgi:hypothetical protein